MLKRHLNTQNAYKMSKVLKVSIFRIFRIFTTFSNFPFYMEFWVFKWRLSLTRVGLIVQSSRIWLL